MKVVVGVSGGDEQADALALAARLASVEGGRLIVAHAYPWSRVVEILDAPYAAALEREGTAILTAAREQLGSTPCETRLLPATSAPRALHELARDAQADLLVVGSSHRGRLRRATIGGVADRLIPGATCPVVVAPRGSARESGPLRRIGVGYDARGEAEAALEWAADLAQRSGASLTILQAFDIAPVATYPGFGGRVDEALVERVREEAERSVETARRKLPAAIHAEGRVTRGPASDAMAIAAADLDLDLLVAGSRGYGPVGALLLGSTSRALIHDAPCPVVVLPRTTEWTPEDDRTAEALAIS